MTRLHELPDWVSVAEREMGEDPYGQRGSTVTTGAGGMAAPHSRLRSEGTPERVGGVKTRSQHPPVIVRVKHLCGA